MVTLDNEQRMRFLGLGVPPPPKAIPANPKATFNVRTGVALSGVPKAKAASRAPAGRGVDTADDNFRRSNHAAGFHLVAVGGVAADIWLASLRGFGSGVVHS